ncbi:KR domain-containing protein, partial [Streptomyces palmae]
AAVNGPSSTVISGTPEQVEAVVTACRERGARARLIEVDYASHGPQVDRLADELASRLRGVRPTGSDIAFCSTVTGERFDPAGLDAEYWFTNLRRPVRFAEAVESLLDAGHRVFIEASPHPVLTVGMQECFEAAGTAALAVPTLRRDAGGPRQLAHALAQAHTAGVSVDWRAWFPDDRTPRVIELPGYAFQRERYWTAAARTVGDISAAGLRPVAHPLLSAAEGLADGGLLLTGLLPAVEHAGWLAEHEVAGVVLLPGAALVEWALRMADEAGAGEVESLTLQLPLVLSSSADLRIQLVAGAPDESGRRELGVYSRPALDSPESTGDWTCHATGTLAPPAARAGESLAQWPPAGAEPVDVTDLYTRAADAGYHYGPAFQGVRAAWRSGGELFAEVELPQPAEAQTGGQDGSGSGFGIHPALLDAALHPVLLAEETGEPDAGEALWLPFSWTGVSLHATGATTVRVRLQPREPHGSGVRELSLTVADTVGAPVLSVESLAMRPADSTRLTAARRNSGDGLFTVEWTPLPRSVPAPEPGTPGQHDWAVLGTPLRRSPIPSPAGRSDAPCHADLPALLAALGDGGPAPAVVLTTAPPIADDAGAEGAARDVEQDITETGAGPRRALAAVQHMLDLVRNWLAEPRLLDARLVIVTRGGVVYGDDAPPVDPAAAAVWGLIRSAQMEHPGRFTLVDIDPATDAEPETGAEADRALADAVRRAIDADEPQLAIRSGLALIPRLVRAVPAPDAPGPDLTGGTVLISGGTGVLGSLVAEHLARTHHTPRLLLLSRQGADAPGATELRQRLEDTGTQVDIAAVDVTDHTALTDTLATIPAEHPLIGVIHTAGVLDDGLIDSWTTERLTHIWAPKATGAWNLHHLTQHLPLKTFTVFSSAAGVLGNPGQTGYAAANAYTDALMTHRSTTGLPGLSLAWSLWEQTSTMTQHLTHTDLTRLTTLGMRPLTTPHALTLLDTALTHTPPLLVAADLDTTRLDAAGPAMLRALVRPSRRRAADGRHTGPALTTRLAALDQHNRHELL